MKRRLSLPIAVAVVLVVVLTGTGYSWHAWTHSPSYALRLVATWRPLRARKVRRPRHPRLPEVPVLGLNAARLVTVARRENAS
jgi:hypothetical protein